MQIYNTGLILSSTKQQLLSIHFDTSMKILFSAILKQHQCKYFYLFFSLIIDFLCFSFALNENEASVTGQVPKEQTLRYGDLCAGSLLESALRANSCEEIKDGQVEKLNSVQVSTMISANLIGNSETGKAFELSRFEARGCEFLLPH